MVGNPNPISVIPFVVPSTPLFNSSARRSIRQIHSSLSQSKTHLFLWGLLSIKGQQIPGIQAQAIGTEGRQNSLLSSSAIARVSSTRHSFLLIVNTTKVGVTYRYVADERLNATNGGNAEMEGSGEIEVRIQEWSGKSTELVIPKNSFGILKFKKLSNCPFQNEIQSTSLKRSGRVFAWGFFNSTERHVNTQLSFTEPQGKLKSGICCR